MDAYAKWRVKDAERFYTATSGLKQIADERLSRRLESGLRDQFGKRTLHEVVSGERDALMADITRSLNTMAEKKSWVSKWSMSGSRPSTCRRK
nr:hypothetical protein GCM10020185_24400 [Pseudomonas brassicacearum subsp. brassicacearum]